jgi:Tol biopolymer transport system component
VSPSGVYLNLRRFSGNEQFVVKRGADIEEILSGAQPAWAPDSKSIAYIRNKENKANPLPRNQSPMAALVVYSLSTRDEKRLIPDTELGAAIGSPAWSHDGKVLWQLIQDSHGVRLLYRADIKTGIFTRVAENVVGNNSMFAALSSDDKTIYMIDQSPGQVRTCLMVPITSIDVNSGQQRQIVSLPRPRRFILSSDQKTLYSTVCREDANTGDTPRNKAIVSVDLATGVQKQILSLQNPDELTIFDLALSPDGRTLVFTVETGTSAQRNSHSRLYRVGVDGDGYRKLADVPSETGVSWSRNGSILFLEPESWEPINIPSNGNDPEMRSVPRCVNCSLSPDGLRVFKPRGDYFELWALENVSSSLASRK